jgi:N-acetylglucosamine-6-sulfatase
MIDMGQGTKRSDMTATRFVRKLWRWSTFVFLLHMAGLDAPDYAWARGTTCSEDCGNGQQDWRRPNIVMVVVDDMRWKEYSAAGHPYVQTPNIDRLANEGVTFTNAHHVNPLCSPSRASILTGQYPSRHGIVDNTARDRLSHRLKTFPMALQRAGYHTAHIGKWHMGNDPTPRPGYDYWVSFPGQGRSVDPELYEGGQLHRVDGYMTDLLTDRALDFLQSQSRDGRPFFLYLGHKAVHPDIRQNDDGSVDTSSPAQFMPAPRHLGQYDSQLYPRRPNVAIQGLKVNKPLIYHALELKNSPEIRESFGAVLDPGTSESTIRRRAEMLLAIDESLGRIMKHLNDSGLLAETLVLFTSDNGYFYGEHGLSIERRMPYEEATRAPLLVWYAAFEKQRSIIDALVSTIDIAPTLLELARAEIGNHIQGKSMMSLLVGQADSIRSSHMTEYYNSELAMPWLNGLSYKSIRTDQFKYIHWTSFDGVDELYDLRRDPYETSNVIAQRIYADELLHLQTLLESTVVDAADIR